MGTATVLMAISLLSLKRLLSKDLAVVSSKAPSHLGTQAETGVNISSRPSMIYTPRSYLKPRVSGSMWGIWEQKSILKVYLAHVELGVLPWTLLAI